MKNKKKIINLLVMLSLYVSNTYAQKNELLVKTCDTLPIEGKDGSVYIHFTKIDLNYDKKEDIVSLVKSNILDATTLINLFNLFDQHNYPLFCIAVNIPPYTAFNEDILDVIDCICSFNLEAFSAISALASAFF